MLLLEIKLLLLLLTGEETLLLEPPQGERRHQARGASE